MEPQQYTVLFVDDEEANRVVFRANFGPHFHVLLAASAEEALRMLAETPVAVLMADQRMPGMTGVELAEVVRVKHPDVIRIIVTAYADAQAAIDAINRGQVSRYISKPWNVLDVRTYLQGAIELHHVSGRLQQLQTQLLRSERLVTLGLVAGSIAHDLGSPIASVMLNLETLTLEAQRLCEAVATFPAARDLAQEVATLVRDTRSITQQVCRVLTAVQGSIRAQPTPSPVAMSTAVQVAARLAKGEFSHKATLQVECDPEAVVLGDLAELTQVVVNLVVNASNAIGGNSPSLNEIAVQVAVVGPQVILRVRDTGCGIAPDLQERIFEPLFTTRQANGGTGLGLAIVRRIVQAMGGTIQLSSDVGKGTTFTICLPRYT
jgi:two-component system, NtrC family, sensor kinase